MVTIVVYNRLKSPGAILHLAPFTEETLYYKAHLLPIRKEGKENLRKKFCEKQDKLKSKEGLAAREILSAIG